MTFRPYSNHLPLGCKSIQRHINLVYSVALRYVGDPHEAQDVSQAVFIVLARKAAHLRKETIMSGWLYQTARFTSARVLRGEVRRQRREQEALMQSSLTDSPGEAPWEKLAPVLDEALARLGGKERNAILLRFFEGHSITEVALALGLTEPAAKKRIERAVDKLRGLIVKRGVVISGGALAGAMAADSVQAAPAGWTPVVAAAAAAKGAGASLSSLTLAKATLKLMAWLKLKTAAVAGATAILAAGTAVLAVKAALAEPEKAASAAGGDAEDQGAQFRQFLRDASPIKRIVYSHSADTSEFQGKPLAGTLTFDLSVQKARWYLQPKLTAPTLSRRSI